MDDSTAQRRRDQALWEAWTTHGVTSATQLTVDYFLYARSREGAEGLAAALAQAGFPAAIRGARGFLWMRRWLVQTGETSAHWSFEKLQERSALFIRYAEQFQADYDGCGAAVPGQAPA